LILTVTPNVALDKTYLVDGFHINRIHRPVEMRTSAGGKGVNVARVLKTLGRPALATGFCGGHVGRRVVELIEEEGIQHDFVCVEGESRLALAVIDTQTGTQTEVNENGPEILAKELDAIFAKVREHLSADTVLVLSGSCPPGVPDDFFAQLITMANEAGAKSVLDASGAQLINGVKAQPYMAKPNVLELGHITGREIRDWEEVQTRADELVATGIKVVAVTMGGSGAMVTDGKQAFLAVPPRIKLVSAVGSGDSFTAGFLDAMLSCEPLDRQLAMGTAAGTANATTYCAGYCTKDSIMEIAQQIDLRRLS